MLLGIVDDLTSLETLDAELLSAPDSGFYFNSGVLPSITVDNLLHFLPNIDKVPATYDNSKVYGKFNDSRLFSDIVTHLEIKYQSKTVANQGNTPASNPDNWLETDLNSLRLKVFIDSVERKVLADVNLVRRQVDSQYLYNLVEQNRDLIAQLLPNDFAGWMFEPKGSDYTRITINEVALQATTVTPQNLYVINQGVLITTIILNPNVDGRLVFEDIDFNIPSNKGQWFFVIDSQDVLTDGGYIDPLKFDGFVARTISGIGATPEDSIYSFGTNSNGLNFNITVHFDPAVYIEKNLKNFGKYYQATFELQALTMFRTNANDRSGLQQRTQMDETQLAQEVLGDETNRNTSFRRYNNARMEAIKMLEKTNDREIENNDDDSISITIRPH